MFLFYFQSESYKYQDFTLFGEVRLFNRSELLQSYPSFTAFNDYELVLMLLANEGPESIRKIDGDFAFVVFHEELKTVWLFKDRLGTKALFYAKKNGKFYFSDSVDALKKQIGPSLNLEYFKWVATQQELPVEATCFQEIKRFPPAHFAQIGADQEMHVKRYWNLFDVSVDHSIQRADAVKKSRELIEKAILKRIKPGERVACQLSGGLDSSLLAAILHKHNRLDASYSLVLNEETRKFSEKGIDEQNAQQQVMDFVGIKPEHHVKIEGFHYQNVEACLERRNEIMGGYAQTDCYWQESIFKKAQEKNIQIIFSGFPGDEGISANGGKWFFDYFYEKNYIWIFNQLFKYPLATLKMAYRYLQVARSQNFYISIQKLLNSRNILRSDLSFTPLKDPEFKASFRYFLLSRIIRAHTCHRTESENLYAKAYQLQMAFPMADKELIEYLASLPAELFQPGKKGRQFFRDICQPYLPESVVNQTKRNGAFTLAFVEYWKAKEYQFFQENLPKDDLNLFIEFPKDKHLDFEDSLKYTMLGEMDYFIHKHLKANE